MIIPIEIIKQVANEVAPKFGIKSIELFGSYADGIAKEESDIDLMVEFEKRAVSLFVISDVKYEFEEKLKKQVDVIHSPLPKNSIIKTNKVISVYGQ